MGVTQSFDLTGRVALVTGASRGLGRTFAQALSGAGATVAATATTLNGVGSTVDDINSSGGRASAYELDVRDTVAVEDTVARIRAELGRIDVLINNAGVCFHNRALDVPDSEWDAVWDVNVHGVWRCSRAVARTMIADQRGGSIVNIGSISGFIVNRPQWQPGYNATKAAVHHLTKSLAAEWAEYRIRVNALAPGYFKTDAAPVDRPEFRQHWIEDAPMRRFGDPDELAGSIVYLASDASSFMTGSVVVFDGGYTIY
jgi:NAD(P)-dependent dehydrogenase (short-subunit alcohol dehydrogenase family)